MGPALLASQSDNLLRIEAYAGLVQKRVEVCNAS